MDTTTIARRPARRSVLDTVADRPGATVARLLPIGIGIMVAVDRALGDRAEYFNAAELLAAWGSALTGGDAGDHHFLMGQERLGEVPALLAGSALLVAEPAVVLGAVVGLTAAVVRRGRGRRPRR